MTNASGASVIIGHSCLFIGHLLVIGAWGLVICSISRQGFSSAAGLNADPTRSPVVL